MRFRIVSLIQKLIGLLKKSNFRKVLPLFYFLFLVLGGILTLVYAFIPEFTACSSIFGEKFCTPYGIFLMLVVSLPGYLIAGNILFFIKELHWGVSLIIVAATSALFYYLLGFGLDKLKSKALNAENVSKILIIMFFVILFLTVVVLL